MFMRIDRLQAELPPPKKADPNAAAALQELLGGKYGEMSTLGNYMFQSFNFRSKSKLRPFYELVASITAEELGHLEIVSNGVVMLANGPDDPKNEKGGADISKAPFEAMQDIRSTASFVSYGGGAVPVNSNSMSWNVDMVTTTGNVVVDLLHNFHLECGARLHKLRVYEMQATPTGREVCGYLLVRGSVHAHAYALALKQITGVEIEKMLPTPNIDLSKIPECQKYLDEGSHRRSTRGAPRTTSRSAASGTRASTRCPAIRPVRLKWSTVTQRAARSTTSPAWRRRSRPTTRRRRCSRSRPSSTRSRADAVRDRHAGPVRRDRTGSRAASRARACSRIQPGHRLEQPHGPDHVLVPST